MTSILVTEVSKKTDLIVVLGFDILVFIINNFTLLLKYIPYIYYLI